MKTRSRATTSRQNSKISNNDATQVPSGIVEAPQRPNERHSSRQWQQQRQRRSFPVTAYASAERDEDGRPRTRSSSRQPDSKTSEHALPVGSIATRSARSSSSAPVRSRDTPGNKRESNTNNSDDRKGKSSPKDRSVTKEVVGKSASKSKQIQAEASLKNDEEAAKTTNPDEEREGQGDEQHLSHPPDVVLIVGKGKDDPGTTATRSRGPKLHEPTLRIVKLYLEQYLFQGRRADDELDDDSMVHLILRTQKNNATNQSQQGEKLDDSTVISDDTAWLEELELREFEHAVGHDLFKRITEETSASQQKASGLDKRTMNWIKRAAGLHRDAEFASGLVVADHVNAKNANQKRMSTRRYTRKMVTDRRDEKKHSSKSHMHELAAAVDELEAEFGPFPLRPASQSRRRNQRNKNDHQREKRRIRQKEQDSHSISGEENDKKHKNKQIQKRNRKYRLGEEEAVKSHRSKREEKKISHKDSSARKSSQINAKLQQQGKKKRKNDERETDTMINKKPKTFISLRNLDWLWRQKTQFPSNGMIQQAIDCMETKAQFRTRKSLVLHPTLVQSGVVHRLPRIKNFQFQKDSPGDNAPEHIYDPPRRRHEHDDVYATLCARLLRSLHGPARMFATFEFFYSDLDREWYNHNPFAEDAFKLGIPKNAQLIRREWATVRRRIRRKPRRFSKRFIMAQFNERNAYRYMVRKIQSNPLLSDSTSFPYNVYAPIRVGTLVTAYNKRFRIIQRGRVLTYDRHTALYLIEFENKQFGFELCPDSEVATCGGPQMLIHAASNSKDTLFAGIPTTPLAAVSGAGPLPIAKRVVNKSKENDIVDLLNFHPIYSPNKIRENNIRNCVPAQKVKQKKAPLLDRIANYEAFTTLLEVIDTARNRKHDLLACLEDANSLMVENLPFGYPCNSSVSTTYSGALQDHRAWIESNLVETCQVLATAMEFLRTLYGESYLPRGRNKPNDSGSNESIARERLLQSAFESSSINDRSSKWLQSLLTKSMEVGSEIVEAMIPSQSEKSCDRCEDLLDKHMLFAGQLLSAATYAENLASRGSVFRFDTTWALQAILHENLSSEKESGNSTNFPAPSGPDLFYSEVLDARERARKDLEEAITLFNGELELAKLKWSMGAEVR